MNSINDAKDCPFCGSSDVGMSLNNYTSKTFSYVKPKTVYHVECYECASRGPVQDHYDDAVVFWNKAERGKNENHRNQP